MHISDFLEKFKKIQPVNADTKNALVEILSKKYSIEVSIDVALLKNGVITIKASPVVKNMIFIHKKKLLAELQTVFLGISITDIR
jgi:hypothetical protein